MEGLVSLREVRPSDLDRFFDLERDPIAARQAAFTAKDPNDRAAFDRHWQKILADPSVLHRTVLHLGETVGYVAFFELLGPPSIAYWIDRRWWGQGIASRALQLFLLEVDQRPVHARVVRDNLASQHVLIHCGFVPVGTDHAYSDVRGEQVEEQIWRLDGVTRPGERPSPRPGDG